LAVSTVTSCRSRFPIFERLAYVNSCSQGALSDSVRAAYLDFLEGWDDRGAPWDYWVERSEAARSAFARLVNGAPGDVAVTTSASAGLSAFASAIDFDERPRVVISDFEFPTVGQIWHAQELRGAEVVHVAAEGNEIPLERFEQAIDERTAVVSITAVCYRNGARLPVEEIAKIARNHGALVVLDAYQAIGTYPLDVQALGVDVVTAGVLKYLLASAGLGFMWTAPGLAEGLLPTADRLVRRSRHLRDGHPRLLTVADRAAVSVGHAADPRDLRGHRRDRADGGDRDRGDPRARQCAERPADRRRRRARRGWSSRRASTSGGVRSSASGRPTRLRSWRRFRPTAAVTSERDGSLRVSPHSYNNEDDIDAVLASLARHRELLRPAQPGFAL